LLASVISKGAKSRNLKIDAVVQNDLERVCTTYETQSLPPPDLRDPKYSSSA